MDFPKPRPEDKWLLRPRNIGDGWVLLRNEVAVAGSSFAHCVDVLSQSKDGYAGEITVKWPESERTVQLWQKKDGTVLREEGGRWQYLSPLFGEWLDVFAPKDAEVVRYPRRLDTPVEILERMT